MNIRRRYFNCILLFLIYSFTVDAQPITLKQDINWPEFMSRQDMIWEKLPEYWHESAYLGNGRLGLMIYKEPGENYLRLETGNCDVHDHRTKRDVFGIPRLLTGYFALHPKGEIISGKMRLDLWNAEASTDIITTKGVIHLQTFVHTDNMIIAVKATTEGEEHDFKWEWVAAEANSPRYLLFKKRGQTNKIPKDYELNPAPIINRKGDINLSVQKLLAGGETTVGWKETQPTKKERTLWINLTHTYPQNNSSEICKTEIRKAIREGYPSLQKTHRKWWNSFYPSSFITLPEAQKENFYWIQMYKLASATRGDRALIDNTGPWLTETPWPNAWWDLNVQLTYWALNASDHLDLAASLENALYNHIDQLRLNINPAYRHNSLGIGVASNLECMSTEVGIPGKGRTQVGLLPWACHNLWLIYRHKMDDDILRNKLFPLLKESINYYLHFLKKGEDGKLHLPATYSPEYDTAEDCNFDLALLRWGCQTLLESAQRLNIQDPLAETWEDVLHNLTPYPMDENGLLIGKDMPYVFSHRHYSHLLAIYPLYLINKEQPGDIETIEKSLVFWQSKPKALLGYSCTGASSISSAIGKGNDALSYLNKLFGKFLSPTTMYKESGPVIETPLSGAQSIHDMLLQSWGGKIRIFPAIPDAWKDIAYSGLRTEGAFKVSAGRKKGKTQFIHIKSLAGEPCIITTDITNPVFNGKRNFTVQSLENSTYQIDLKKGEEVFISPKGEEPEFVISPIPHTSHNHFGLKIIQ
ncbi:glycoside hydrolase family 95-like protein [uncultured Bacteroides sp.]|uniref:glycosyl hydrolase family 95 catalytic domain-containing protein n=1 Tax=uncultured Bacteroides sp. TaxID=162156 RepID=UPI00280BB8C9|nr:alpha-L-fucosidase [uncultured Bacteroides sp.]